MTKNTVFEQVQRACRHLLSEQNRDFSTTTYGCFDRRYWGWKLVDYPEATFQRNVYPLAWQLSHLDDKNTTEANMLKESVIAGLEYASKIQHKDGSFDQAFPHEHSFGATAFLITPLLRAYKTVQKGSKPEFQARIERSLLNAADFLCAYNEEHGHIANHLAGASLSLLEMDSFFENTVYKTRGKEILLMVVANQSPEGWYREYEGADPGYQTLAMYYLAQIYEQYPSQELHDSLEKAVHFIAHFVHPDGTFGGEYGARRTAIFYPGGLALLSRHFPMARAVTFAMKRFIEEDKTTTLGDVDMGNFAPLLSNYITALDATVPAAGTALPPLPKDDVPLQVDFPEAGIHVRGQEMYYTVVGVSNGGVLKVFKRETQRCLWDDAGYLAELDDGQKISTQMTLLDRSCNIASQKISVESDFYAVLDSTPTPFRFLILRMLNLSVMRSLWLGNLIKKLLVSLLIGGKRPFPLSLTRTIIFEDSQVIVKDEITKRTNKAIKTLSFGGRFNSIHMASARYFDGQYLDKTRSVNAPDVAKLNSEKRLLIKKRVWCKPYRDVD